MYKLQWRTTSLTVKEINMKKTLITLALTMVSAGAFAQMDNSNMNHDNMDHGKMDHGS
ncbi:hypothetical protein D046_1756A, partial [Vibrio parahaemolyticus V-223/04]